MKSHNYWIADDPDPDSDPDNAGRGCVIGLLLALPAWGLLALLVAGLWWGVGWVVMMFW